MQTEGTLIAIEGTNGAGKSTQFDLLAKKLQKEGHEVEALRFPQYTKDSSYFVREYLAGKFGRAQEIGPYTASLFYALDRYEASKNIKEALNAGKVVITDRYTGSNMAHQGTYFNDAEQRRGFFIWLDQIEFETFKIPRPDISIVLRVPAEVAVKNVDGRGNKKDIHEKSLEHMKKSVEVYDNLCQLFPKDFKQIDCARSGKILDKQAIADQIWQTVSSYLPTADQAKKKIENNIKQQSGTLRKNGDYYEITDEGNSRLSELVTNNSSDVYAFTGKLSAQTVAAAMARLSRRADDMRVTLLDEFVDSADNDEQLLKRIITAYGDDSVQQLVGQHLVVENASNLLTKKLEWGRLGAYLEQSTRYIYFDKKNKDGNYPYYRPKYLNPEVNEAYVKTMNRIFDNYSHIASSLTDYIRAHSAVSKKAQDQAWRSATKAQACDVARAVLPAATTSTVGIYASAQSIESMIINLASDEMLEANEVGRKILREARKVIPAFLERTDMPERGMLTMAHKASVRESIKEIVREELGKFSSVNGDQVTLVEFWPKNELDIVSDILYGHSTLSLQEINKKIERWPIKKKKETLEAYIGERHNRRHKPGRALEEIHYSWDVLCDYGIFRDLQRHRMVDDLGWQDLTPRYGYEMPLIAEQAGLSDKFEECFDLSLELYSLLQQHGYEQEAQYATLMGHRMRWKVTFNARQAFHIVELRTSPQGHPGYRKIVKLMHEKIAEVHPLIASSMKFVNKGDDPELSRLAAERKSQKKITNLKSK